MDWLDSNIYLSTLVVGLTCSASCSQISVYFLGSWISGSESNSKKGLKDILYFLSGKAVIYILLAVLSSFIGIKLQEVYAKFLGNNASVIFYIFLIIFGIFCIVKFFQDVNCKSCKGRKQKSHFDITPKKALLAGVMYGITPCFPMTVLMVNASMTSLFQALILGSIFALTSFINPLLLVGIISGKISQSIRKDISQFIKYFQLLFSISFVIIGVVYLIKLYY
jgi:sulfite exporter TauE/SafE